MVDDFSIMEDLNEYPCLKECIHLLKLGTVVSKAEVAMACVMVHDIFSPIILH